jgi:hypothetical protein
MKQSPPPSSAVAMDPRLLFFFQAEVELQCKAVLVAASEIDKALGDLNNSWPPSEPVSESDRVWIAVQNLLAAAANVSKLLWGSGGKAALRRTDLRNSIGVSDSSPLRDKNLRNDFEHFDERLELWHANAGRNFVARIIGGTGSIIAGGDPDAHFQRLDPATGEVAFLAHKGSLVEMVSEANAILSRLPPIIERAKVLT